MFYISKCSFFHQEYKTDILNVTTFKYFSAQVLRNHKNANVVKSYVQLLYMYIVPSKFTICMSKPVQHVYFVPLSP